MNFLFLPVRLGFVLERGATESSTHSHSCVRNSGPRVDVSAVKSSSPSSSRARDLKFWSDPLYRSGGRDVFYFLSSRTTVDIRADELSDILILL